MLAQAYLTAGKKTESFSAQRRALALMEERLELNPDDSRAWSLAATTYAHFGNRERAEEASRRALAIDDDALTYYNVACTYALLKEEDKALDNLEAAHSKGWHHKEWLSHDPDFDFVRETDRYKRIVAGIRH